MNKMKYLYAKIILINKIKENLILIDLSSERFKEVNHSKGVYNQIIVIMINKVQVF
jgi:hypothetical protein